MENQKIKSEGKCIFCEKLLTKGQINTHLKKHLIEKTKTQTPGTSYYIKIIDKYNSDYFLYLLISDKTILADIDKFLRDIWLECCGHLSEFRDKNDYEENGYTMNRTVPRVFFEKGQKIRYEYDFGSTTELELTILEILLFKTDEKITLLSRNEPLNILCSTCKKLPAIELCGCCIDNGDGFFCEKCAKKHKKTCEDFEDCSFPVVNSPRLGTCAYSGGSIDTERDGVFKI